jgi:hypothetical protein
MIKRESPVEATIDSAKKQAIKERSGEFLTNRLKYDG